MGLRSSVENNSRQSLGTEPAARDQSAMQRKIMIGLGCLRGQGRWCGLILSATFALVAASLASGEEAKPISPPVGGNTVIAPDAVGTAVGVDAVQLITIQPAAGTYLKRGNPVSVQIEVRYTLVSQDEASLEISIGEMPADVPNCGSNQGQLVDVSNSAQIWKGTHQIAFFLTWSGDTGSKSKGIVYNTGYIALYPTSSTKGPPAKTIKNFGMLTGSCLPFGP